MEKLESGNWKKKIDLENNKTEHGGKQNKNKKDFIGPYY